MHAQALAPCRRSFLKLGAIGTAALIGGGWVAARLTDGSAAPVLADAANLTPAVQQMLWRSFDATLHGIIPEGREQELLTRSLAVLDQGMSGMAPHMRKELTSVLSLLAFAPARLALTGRWSGWQDASRDEVAQYLTGLRDSDTALRRLVFVTLHDLATSSFYALEESWPLVGYDGPWFTGPGQEV
ncbi:MAG: hypothetical protein ACK5IP_09900 [Paracoccus sp. (in: a-proteobacteria)]